MGENSSATDETSLTTTTVPHTASTSYSNGHEGHAQARSEEARTATQVGGSMTALVARERARGREASTSTSTSKATGQSKNKKSRRREDEDDLSRVRVRDDQGRKVRNATRHAGQNTFLFHGHGLTSRDNVPLFVLALCIGAGLPALFLAFNASYIWDRLGAGGKASVVVFAYLALLMCTSMAQAAFRDPGIVPRALDPDPRKSWVRDSHRDADDAHVPTGEWRIEPRYVRVRHAIIASKCASLGLARVSASLQLTSYRHRVRDVRNVSLSP